MPHYIARLLLSLSCVAIPSLGLAQSDPVQDSPLIPHSVLNQTNAELIPTAEDQARYVTGFEPPPEGGSETMARILKKLEPSVDTRIPESPTQAALRINRLISAKQYDSALKELSKLIKPDGNMEDPSTDVQLRFLLARAHAGKGNLSQATEIYQDMSFKYPELAEPWNNLAAIQLQLGLPDQALQSLKMAIEIRPNYPEAQQNLGMLYTILANRSFKQSNTTQSRTNVNKTQNILDGK